MRISRTLVWCLVLTGGALSTWAQVDDPPQRPEQYAQAVLQVEGMI